MEIRISDSSRGREILQRMHELSALPGFSIYQELMALNTSIYILDKNFQELDTFLLDLLENPKWDYLFLVENRHVLHKVSEDIVRRLHNFVAAVLSLRDHTRRLYSKYYRKGDLIPEYEKISREAFADNPQAQFVQKLREYCQHYVSPLLSFQSAWNSGQERPVRTAVLRKDELLRFDGWNAAAKQHLNGSPDSIDFLVAMRNYHSQVLEFYTWFQSHQEQVHMDELSEFRKKEGELLRVQLEDKLDRCLTAKDEQKCSEGSLFFHIFTKPDFEKLALAPNSPGRRLKIALEILRQRFDVDAGLEDKLGEAYAMDTFGYYKPAQEGQSAEG